MNEKRDWDKIFYILGDLVVVVIVIVAASFNGIKIFIEYQRQATNLRKLVITFLVVVNVTRIRQEVVSLVVVITVIGATDTMIV